MLTKIPDNPSPRFLKNKKTRILLGAFLLLIYSGIIFILGVLAHRDNVVNTLRFEEVKQTLLFFKKPLYLFKNLLETPHRITIDINYKNYSKLAFDRKNALENRNKSFDYVSANLVSNGKTSPIKIRLKGDRRIHFEDKEKWSFRIKTKGENTVFGMKWFSLQKPRARNYIYEWLFHEVLRREGLIALRYKFVHLVLNGKD
ncbi:MAG: hypothetical protein GY757_00340, partial [bacterium]|nr:hypothetical protein [bacterium]